MRESPRGPSMNIGYLDRYLVTSMGSQRDSNWKVKSRRHCGKSVNPPEAIHPFLISRPEIITPPQTCLGWRSCWAPLNKQILSSVGVVAINLLLSFLLLFFRVPHDSGGWQLTRNLACWSIQSYHFRHKFTKSQKCIRVSSWMILRIDASILCGSVCLCNRGSRAFFPGSLRPKNINTNYWCKCCSPA